MHLKCPSAWSLVFILAKNIFIMEKRLSTCKTRVASIFYVAFRKKVTKIKIPK